MNAFPRWLSASQSILLCLNVIQASVNSSIKDIEEGEKLPTEVVHIRLDK